MNEIFEKIRAHHTMAVLALKQQQRSDRAMESFIVFNIICALHCVEKGDEARKKALKKAFGQAQKLIKAIIAAPNGPFDPELAALVLATENSRGPWDHERAAHEKIMIQLAKQLPVWNGWARDIRGFGALSLARIIGETGNLSNYSTREKLWKRLGLAVIDGARQGNPGQNASDKDWARHGYSPKRRSVTWVVANSLFRLQSAIIDDETGEINREPGRYRLIYDREKSKQLANGLSNGHAHARALRVMEKQLIADLWSAWRRLDQLNDGDKPIDALSTAAESFAGRANDALLHHEATVLVPDPQSNSSLGDETRSPLPRSARNALSSPSEEPIVVGKASNAMPRIEAMSGLPTPQHPSAGA